MINLRHRLRRTHRIALLWISAALLLMLVAPEVASAHGYIVRAIPEDRAALKRSPARLQYWFSENLEPEFTSMTVRDQAGNVIATGGVEDSDLSLLSARLPPNLADGAYIAELRTAFASDGHVIVESQVFFVGDAVGGVAGVSSGQQAEPLEVVWRVLVLSSSLMLLGAFAVYSMVLVPAWGSAKYPAGLLPPRVMTRLNWIVAIALLVAFGGNMLALIQQSMTFFGADAGRVISDGLYNVVRIGTRFGDTWNARMGLLMLVTGLFAAGVYLRGSQPETVRAFWVANVWVTMLVLGTFSVASHAAGSLMLPWLAIGSDWLHGAAVGFWAGGVAALALVLPAAVKPYTGEARRQAILAALRRFTWIAAVGLLIVITTGIYNALNWFTTPNELVSSYGGALLLKLILVAVLVAVGAAHHITVSPERYQRWSRVYAGVIARMQALIPTLRIEAVLVLAVLISVGYLSATPIPPPRLAGQTTPPPSNTQVVDGYTISTAITPGGPGINTYDVEIEREGQAVDGVIVSLQMSEPARDQRGDWHQLESIGEGQYASVGDEISQAGEWWTVVEFSDPARDATAGSTRAAFDWQISDDASVINSRPPTLLNWLALAGVIASLLYAVYPVLSRFYRTLDLSPVTVTVALGATAATVAAFVIGILLTAQAGEQYQLTVNPPPQIINVVLPSQDSVARGRSLYDQACGAWAGNADVGELVRRLDRTRDEALYAAVTREGWWTLPACDADYGDDQWWDVVNYIRSMQAVSG